MNKIIKLLLLTVIAICILMTFAACDLNNVGTITHKYETWTIIKAPTCTEAGEQVSECIYCGKKKQKEAPALGHNYIATVTEPTATQEGFTTYVCSRCGDTYVGDKVAAKGETSTGGSGTGESGTGGSSTDGSGTDGSGSGESGSGTGGTDVIEDTNFTYLVLTDGTYEVASYKGTDTSVVIPDTVQGKKVTSIRHYAFSSESITSVTIGSNIMSIKQYAFSGCSSLTSVYYAGDVASWCGITFDYDSNPLSYAHNLYINNELVTSLVIPDVVTEIKDYAFTGATCITAISIPDTITSIGQGAFDGCTNLQHNEYDNAYYWGNSTNSYVVLVAAKSNDISSCEIAENTKIIYERAFLSCSNLTSIMIPDSVVVIGNCAFCSCSSLTNVTIPESVTSIGDVAFSDCENLQYNEYDNAYYLGNDTNPYVVLMQGKNSDITTCTINQNTKHIHSNAFYECLIPDSEELLGMKMYGPCRSITNIIIPNSVMSIGGHAFFKCSSLASVTIGNGVTSIGESAFEDCAALSSVSIGNGVISIGESAFKDCTSLTSITIPDSVTSIGSQAFSGCTLLTSITIPDSVTSIGSQAFSGCTLLTSLTIGNAVTSIGDDVFEDCIRLVEVYNKSSITNWMIKQGNSYYYVDGFVKAIYTEPYESKLSTDENGYIIYTDGSEKSLIGYIGNETVLMLPSGLTEINRWAFEGNVTVTSITIPASVTTIGYGAFVGCTSLSSVDFAEGSCLSQIEDDAFGGCGITSITIPSSTTRIGFMALGSCSNLTTITFYPSLTNIDGYVFYNSNQIADIYYNGTMEQLMSSGLAEKVYIPKNNNITQTIHCTNGDIPI